MGGSDRPSWVRLPFLWLTAPPGWGEEHLKRKKNINQLGKELQMPMGLYSVRSREPGWVVEWKVLWSEPGFRAFNRLTRRPIRNGTEHYRLPVSNGACGEPADRHLEFSPVRLG